MIDSNSSILRDAKPAIQQASDGLMQGASHAVDVTRDYANGALDKADSKVRDLRNSIEPAIDMLTAKGQKLARQSMDMAADAKDRAQKQFNRAAGATTQYVSEQPMRSVLIAAGVGAAVALLVAALRSNSNSRDRR
ncbi:MAG: DUF883 family protein [Polaromonas sp.]|nr:DUF883 family protein [Polaromonas sp.]